MTDDGDDRRRGPDAYERAIERGLGTPPESDEPPLPSGRGPRRLMLFVVLAGVLVALFRSGLGAGAPDTPGSCTSPVLTLTPSVVRSEGSVRWSLSGPSDVQVVLAVDVTALPGKADPGWLAGPLPLPGCEATGTFGAPLEGGFHTVRVFQVRPDGRATVLTTTPLEVAR